jgi:hypothetical protein
VNARSRPIHPRRALLGGHEPARSRGRGRLLPRCLRLGVRGPRSAGLGAEVLPRPSAGRRGRRGLVAPRVRAAYCDVGHVCLGRERRRDRLEGSRGRRRRGEGAVRRHGRRPHGCPHRLRGRGVLRLAGEGVQRRAGRQRAGLGELQRPPHARRRRREVVLRLRVRLGDARAGGRVPGVDASRLRRPPRGERSRPPRTVGRVRRPGSGSRTSWRASTRSQTTSPGYRRTGA